MMKFKLCSKIHLFIIISTLFIVLGLAAGTICHYVEGAGGFFNYGGEFSSYDSVTINYYSSEFSDESKIKPDCDNVLASYGAINVSSEETTLGGKLVYKFNKGNADGLKKAAAELNDLLATRLEGKLGAGERPLSIVSVEEAIVGEGGARAITFASIAVAVGAVCQFIYFVLRYKLRAAFSALLANLHNLGVFVALAAITRVPVGTEFIAIAAATVFLTMILTCVLFDRTRRNFKNEKSEKLERSEVVDASAIEVRNLTFITVAGLAIAVVILGVFATIAATYIGAFAPYALALLALIAVCYGTVFFTPAVHGGIDALSEKTLAAVKAKSKKKPSKSVESEKASVVSATTETAKAEKAAGPADAEPQSEN